MKRHRMHRMLIASRWFLLLAGGMVPALSMAGCDPTVRTTVLTGIQTALTGLVTSVMNAFFMALATAGTSATSQPVL